ncbi:hypothetical protein HIO71_13965 [Chryseobacterium aquaticum]|uniref:Uncharacterized protein n=1 Tax=Chryseobacterium aquaticum TaxID=452084 RepID=A0A848NAC9_9FLAO|nr:MULTISPECIES: hypothetical protein [Chryseobacterium]NMR35289.1 hypothetical protein [Chryseobacterium aquaticum]NRQ47273.1 hypothetical protein [Chryseobacterium sp. C-204]
MEYKNVNTGNIDAESVEIGDKIYNNITQFIDGLGLLLTEYKQQLDEINHLILAFKPKTALVLLQALEKRINDSQTTVDNKTKSKLLFLKALCKRELSEVTSQESAKDFIHAYNLNKEDEVLKTKACIEYLHIPDSQKAVILADELLSIDEYNLTAWIVKTITSSNIKQFLKTVPNVIINDYGFRHSIIYHIIRVEKLNYLEDLRQYNLKLTFDFEKYKEINFQNKDSFLVAIDLFVNRTFNDHPIRYINGKHFSIERFPELNSGLSLIEKYVVGLENSEIADSTKNQKFYLHFLKYLISNSPEDIQILESLYNEIEKPKWFFTNAICQIYNHQEHYQKALDSLNLYEKSGEELHSEFYLFKSIVLYLLEKNDDIDELYKNYLESTDILDERHLFNIISAFFNVQRQIGNKHKYVEYLDLALQKNFYPNEIKTLLKTIVDLRYIEKYDEKEVYKSLNSIKDSVELNINCKNLIAEDLDFIGKTNEAIQYLDSYLDKSKVSGTLRLYILLLDKQLSDKNDSEQFRYKELLTLLEFWRLNSSFVDEHLCKIEYNLYLTINDFPKLKTISEFLYIKFPSNERYLYSYLVSLERSSDFDKIKDISDSMSEIFNDEEVGVFISGILGRNDINPKKGFDILYNLAKNPSNTMARKNYMVGSTLYDSFFERYDEICFGYYVVYTIGDQKFREQISPGNEFHKNLIGKKIGDQVSIPSPMTNRINSVVIIEIFNDAVNLFREINEEAHNPLNNLGFESFQTPTNPKDFEKMLIEQFGISGSQENERIRESLNNYYSWKIGYTEVVRAVFKDNFIDAYLHLTTDSGSKFTTLPNRLVRSITDSPDILFALDFSSLMLFYFLEKELDFKFIHKFKISYYIKEHIENKILELKGSHKTFMYVQITMDGVRPSPVPEDYNEKRTTFFQSILDWVNENCEIDYVEEKLNVLPKLKQNESDFTGNFSNLMVDNMYFSSNDKYRLISSDSSLIRIKSEQNLYYNYINPEKYLLSYYPEKCNSEFYRFLLKSKYLGIGIGLDTLKNEFYDFIAGRENYYPLVLENLQFTIHGDESVINTCIKFLKHLYLINSLSMNDKNRYASEIFRNTFYGIPSNLILKYKSQLATEFKLLGTSYDEILKEFDLAVKLYYNKS